MDTVTIHPTDIALAELTARAEAGEEIILARGGVPVAKIVPIAQPLPESGFGSWKGKGWVGPEFFDPLPDDELELWSQ